jgi:hypothetical protein
VTRDGGIESTQTHELSVMQRISEGSAQVECSCGYVGPKRTPNGGKLEEDAEGHLRDVWGAGDDDEEPTS